MIVCLFFTYAFLSQYLLTILLGCPDPPPTQEQCLYAIIKSVYSHNKENKPAIRNMREYIGVLLS